jgi:hypothetical protein
MKTIEAFCYGLSKPLVKRLNGLSDTFVQKQKISAALLANSWNKNYTWARIKSPH